MTQPIHLIADVYAVRVPEGAKDFELEIDANEDWYYLIYFLMIDDEDSGFYGEDQQHSVELPPGSWQIICTTKECGEEQAKEMVHSSEWYFPVKHTRYVDYKFQFDRENKQRWSEGFGTALGSFVSLLETKGLNPETNYLIIKKVS